MKLEEIRIAVLTPATAFGSSKPSGGQGPSLATTRRKKYEAKNAPNSITSETMKSRIPSVWRSIRELWCASGGPWCSACSAWPRPMRSPSAHSSVAGSPSVLISASPRSAPTATAGSGELRDLRGGDVVGGLDVLDRLLGDLLDPVDQPLLEPLRLLAREGEIRMSSTR